MESIKQLGCATKITFAQGHGYTIKEINLMEKERQGLVQRLRSTVYDEWHIPKHILVGQAFSYESELYTFVKRIGCNSSYVPENVRKEGENSLLSSALVVTLSHKSTCHDQDILDLKEDICKHGRDLLGLYLMNYFSSMFPNLPAELLHKLSDPLTSLSYAKCYSMFKHLCLHELIRTRSDENLTLQEYSDALGGLFLSIMLFDEHSYISAPVFLQSCVLNYYSKIHFRDMVQHKTVDDAELKLREHYASPEIRVISIDGELTPTPLYNVGIFAEGECVGSAADNTIDAATLAACNAALTSVYFSNRNLDVNINNLDFALDEVADRRRVIEERLVTLLKGLDISEREIQASMMGDSVVTTPVTEENISKVEIFRRLRYEKK